MTKALPLVILEALASRTPVICTPGRLDPGSAGRPAHRAVRCAGRRSRHRQRQSSRLIDQPGLSRQNSPRPALHLYHRLFTMEAFARSVGSLYAALTPRDRDT